MWPDSSRTDPLAGSEIKEAVLRSLDEDLPVTHGALHLDGRILRVADPDPVVVIVEDLDALPGHAGCAPLVVRVDPGWLVPVALAGHNMPSLRTWASEFFSERQSDAVEGRMIDLPSFVTLM